MAFRSATEEPERIALSIEINQLVHEQGAFVPAYYAPYVRSGYWRWVKLPEFIGTKESASVLTLFGSTGGLFWIDNELKSETLSAKRAGETYDPVTIVNTRYKAE